MNLSETALVLAQMQAYDQRTIGDADVIAWHSLLTDAPFEDCREAVRRHYAEQTDRIMPAHVRRIVRDIHGEREASNRATGWAPGQAGVPKEQAMPEVTGPIDEKALTPSVQALLDSVRAMLPEGSREALMPRRVAWEQEHAAYRRTQEADPNPHYRPNRIISCGCGPEHAPGCPHAAEPNLGKESFERCVRDEPHPAHLWGFNDRPSGCPGVAP